MEAFCEPFQGTPYIWCRIERFLLPLSSALSFLQKREAKTDNLCQIY